MNDKWNTARWVGGIAIGILFLALVAKLAGLY